jgi:hypothetical protein
MALHTLDAECVEAKSRVRPFDDREARITNELMERLHPAISGGIKSANLHDLREALWAEMEAEIIGSLIDRLRVRDEDLLGLLRGTHVVVKRGRRR